MPAESQPIRFARSRSDAQEPPIVFRTIAILGLDELGLSLALAARRTWPSALVIGVDGPDRLEQAVRLHAIDVGASDLSILAGAELVVLSCPPQERLGHLQRLSDYVEGDFVVTDLGGSKVPLIERAQAFDRLTFVVGHPVVRPAAPGRRVAAERFDGVPWFIVRDPADPPSGALDSLGRFVTALGAQPEFLGPEEYDRRLSEPDSPTPRGPEGGED